MFEILSGVTILEVGVVFNGVFFGDVLLIFSSVSATSSAVSDSSSLLSRNCLAEERLRLGVGCNGTDEDARVLDFGEVNFETLLMPTVGV